MYDRPLHSTSRSDSVKFLEAVTKPELVYSFNPFTSHTVFRNRDMVSCSCSSKSSLVEVNQAIK